MNFMNTFKWYLNFIVPPKADFSGALPNGFAFVSDAADLNTLPPPNILPDVVVELPTFNPPKFRAQSPEVPIIQKYYNEILIYNINLSATCASN